MKFLQFLFSKKAEKTRAWYEIKRSKDKQFFAVLKAPNGEVILTTEMYTRKENVYKVINRFKEYVNAKTIDKT